MTKETGGCVACVKRLEAYWYTTEVNRRFGPLTHTHTHTHTHTSKAQFYFGMAALTSGTARAPALGLVKLMAVMTDSQWDMCQAVGHLAEHRKCSTFRRAAQMPTAFIG